MKEWFKKVIRLVKTGVWKTDDSDNNEVYWLVRPFRIIMYTIKGVGEHEISLRSAALTIYTIMSLVPIAALIFGILKGFGFDENLTEFLYAKFSDYSNVIDTLMVFVNRMLEKTRGGVIAAVGVVVLIWSVMKVFGNIEDAFNNIWEVRKGRTFARKISDYITVIFIAPLLIVAAISLGTVIRNYLSFLEISWLIDILLGIASLILICVLFTFLYWLMPNTTVKIKGALIGGCIGGVAFFLFSLFYFYIQASISSYNVIYGTFAAIPLFLAWMQTSWLIVLVGSEISFAYQNIDRYDQERLVSSMDNDHRRKVLLATMLSIVKNYLKDQKAVGAEEIATELNLSVRIIRDMVFELEKAGLIVAIKDNKERKIDLYIPAKDVHSIKVSEVLDAIEKNVPDPDFNKSPQMKEVSLLLDEMRKGVYDPNIDVYLPELIKN